jgi:predicted alpha/beta hydrolase family esterase
MKNDFDSRILILPGLGDSGEGHWQTHWEKQFGFKRVNQKDWDTPTCSDWIETIDKEITRSDPSQIILVAHSLACVTTVFWAIHFNRKIKGALLVAPSDVEADTYPPGTAGFSPMPLMKLPFPSITVASSNDYYVTFERATLFANAWGSELVNIGDAGHVNVAAGFGPWESGLKYLRQLDSL